jgi:glycosyltransferase involved in cell wall biosynthesis
MRIAFNATALLSPLTGIGQYAFELATRLAADPAHQLRLFYGLGWSDQVRTTPLPAARTIFSLARHLVPNSYAVRQYLQDRKFRQKAGRDSFDVYHEPNYLAYSFKGPTVVTVHDLSWIRFPQAHPVERVTAMTRYFEPSLRKATLVLTDSEFVKREVIEVFGIDPQRIVPVPLGVSPLFRPLQAQATASLMARLDLRHKSYVLAVGTLEPRKNLVTALRAYAALPEAEQRAYPLVLAGIKGWHNEELDREMAPLVSSGRVRLTGYLSREDLATLVAGATTLVYPSIYEGFGLPPLEAMACGVPTIVSNVASLPEVVGDTGLLIDPYDQDGLRDAMQRLIDQPLLREDLGARALQRAAGFTWEACTEQTVAAYARAVAMA